MVRRDSLGCEQDRLSAEGSEGERCSDQSNIGADLLSRESGYCASASTSVQCI